MEEDSKVQLSDNDIELSERRATTREAGRSRGIVGSKAVVRQGEEREAFPTARKATSIEPPGAAGGGVCLFILLLDWLGPPLLLGRRGMKREGGLYHPFHQFEISYMRKGPKDHEKKPPASRFRVPR